MMGGHLRRPRGKPGRLDIQGEAYRATVLQVIDRDPDNSPRTFRLVRDDESVDLKQGDAFWIVYAPASLHERHN